MRKTLYLKAKNKEFIKNNYQWGIKFLFRNIRNYIEIRKITQKSPKRQDLMPFGVEYFNMRNFVKLKFYEIRSGNFK